MPFCDEVWRNTAPTFSWNHLRVTSRGINRGAGGSVRLELDTSPSRGLPMHSPSAGAAYLNGALDVVRGRIDVEMEKVFPVKTVCESLAIPPGGWA
jgi:hypothetical protein